MQIPFIPKFLQITGIRCGHRSFCKKSSNQNQLTSPDRCGLFCFFGGLDNIFCSFYKINSSQDFGCGFFAYSWKLPAYSGAFLLTVDKFSLFTYSWSFFAYSFSFLTYSWSFFAYSGKVRLIRALRDCKQRSLTVSKKAPTVSKKASPIFLYCKKFGLDGTPFSNAPLSKCLIIVLLIARAFVSVMTLPLVSTSS